MSSQRHDSRFIIGACVGAIALFGIGYFGGTLSERAGRHDYGKFSEDRNQSTYKYINPLLECEHGDDLSADEFRPSERAIKEVIDEHTAAGDVTTVGVYFRDMNNGPWIGVNENDPYAASSMLKIAHMMAVYKAAEYDDELLERPVYYAARYRSEDQTILPEQSLVAGTTYTVGDLVQRMIVYSDNEALYLLQDKVPEADAETVYADLGMEFNLENQISVRGYSTLLRVLYNASYLSSEHSELALQTLTNTRFDDGIRTGVPLNVPVAHKFGERVLTDSLRQLHDCGIVYYAHRPYLLCVMTQGSDQDRLKATIQDIFRAVYSQMRIGFGDE